MRNYYEIYSKWLKKARNEEDVFDKFVYTWFAFNALYSQNMEPDDNEITAIQKTVALQTRNVNQRELYEFLEYSSVRFLGNRVIRNMRHLDRDASWNHRRLKNINNSSTQRVTALFNILYQVRNNLFHGNKLFDRDNDNEVVGNAADALIRYFQIVNRA